jgi:hypothetical protein
VLCLRQAAFTTAERAAAAPLLPQARLGVVMGDGFAALNKD